MGDRRPGDPNAGGPRIVRGVVASAGVAVGRALVLDSWQIDVPRYRIEPIHVPREIRRFHRARRKARREIEALRDKTLARLGERYAAIFDAHLMILGDRKLARETMRRIREQRMNAEWALAAGVRRLLRAFESVEDAYLRERGGDLADVHERLQRIFAGQDDPRGRDLKLDEDTIIIASRLTPSDAAWLQQPRIVGFVTEAGGQTSHTAIIANALEIPALVGARDVTEIARDGEWVVVDAARGEVLLGPDEITLARYRTASAAPPAAEAERGEPGPCATRDGVPFRVAANIEFPEEMAAVRRSGADGIGLYRSEFLYLAAAPRLPGEEEQEAAYRRIAEAAQGRPVALRTLDLGGEKYFHQVLHREDGRANPVLGLRAVRYCLRHPEIFRTQLRAMLRVAWRFPNVEIVFPMISSLEEWREVRRFVCSVAAELEREGFASRPVPLGPMVELPGAALVADRLAEESDFLSIGTNDLVQYTLAVDRGDREVAPLGDPWHPAVLDLVARTVEAGKRRSKPVSLCGEMASDPLGALTLLGLGLRVFSCTSGAVPAIRAVLRAADAGEATRLVAAARTRHATGAEIRRELARGFAGVLGAVSRDRRSPAARGLGDRGRS
ncbi:MAG: phosphoenolpyruvate--protein phosphotransferase [Acidobacteria bacterium]|nr:MAG: phosphoenolpyruvate--protein phosphotransferase [Acidobacteriota bacterium]